MKVYLSEISHGDDLVRDINELAAMGWRLVTLIYIGMGNYRYVMEADADEQQQRKEQASCAS